MTPSPQRQQPAAQPPAAKARQLQTATRVVPKTSKASTCVQPCANTTPPSDWQCVKYHKLRGPKYSNKTNRQPLNGYGRWHAMIDGGKITETDAKVMLLMSPNEGDFNSVQAYDNQALTAGAMQKTINDQGQGELANQLRDFKKANPDKFKTVFADKGWDVDEMPIKDKTDKVVDIVPIAKYSYQDATGKTVVVKGNELYDFIKGYCNTTTSKAQKGAAEKALDAMRQGVEDEDFKDQQIVDFKKRIKDAVKQKPNGYDYPISDYATSAKSQALVLDQSVNRPAYVKEDYGKALDQFYKNNPKAPKNPADWGDKRSEYETQINEIYGNNRRGTDMVNRYNAIKTAADPIIPADKVPKPTAGPGQTSGPIITPPTNTRG